MKSRLKTLFNLSLEKDIKNFPVFLISGSIWVGKSILEIPSNIILLLVFLFSGIDFFRFYDPCL